MPINLSLEEITVHGGHYVLMDVDNHRKPTVGDLHGILGQQLRPRPIHLLNTIIILLSYLKKWGPSQPKLEMELQTLIVDVL